MTVREALILLVIPELRSDIRDPVPRRINVLPHRHRVPAFAGMAKREIDQTFLSYHVPKQAIFYS